MLQLIEWFQLNTSRIMPHSGYGCPGDSHSNVQYRRHHITVHLVENKYSTNHRFMSAQTLWFIKGKVNPHSLRKNEYYPRSWKFRLFQTFPLVNSANSAYSANSAFSSNYQKRRNYRKGRKTGIAENTGIFSPIKFFGLHQLVISVIWY